MELNTCPSCHSKLKDDEKECLGCGRSLIEEGKGIKGTSLNPTTSPPPVSKNFQLYLLTAALSVGPYILFFAYSNSSLVPRNGGMVGPLLGTLITTFVGVPSMLGGVLIPNLKVRWLCVKISAISAAIAYSALGL